MKVAELREKPVSDIQKQLGELLQKLFKLRIRLANQDETVKPHLIKQTRRDIARVKTILNEKLTTKAAEA